MPIPIILGDRSVSGLDRQTKRHPQRPEPPGRRRVHRPASGKSLDSECGDGETDGGVGVIK